MFSYRLEKKSLFFYLKNHVGFFRKQIREVKRGRSSPSFRFIVFVGDGSVFENPTLLRRLGLWVSEVTYYYKKKSDKHVPFFLVAKIPSKKKVIVHLTYTPQDVDDICHIPNWFIEIAAEIPGAQVRLDSLQRDHIEIHENQYQLFFSKLTQRAELL